MSSDVLLADYDRVLPHLRQRGESLARELTALFASHPDLKVHSVSWRLKSRESLAAKLARPDRSYPDLFALTDLIGIRVITYFAESVDRVGELIECKLPVDFERSTDKRRREPTEFGYRSLHYVCRAGSPLPDAACYEIQARTVLEHAWAEIEHDLGYKVSEEIPLAVRRRLSRLAGLLELADQEFGAIRTDLETYASSLPARIDTPDAAIPLDGYSLVALLEHPDLARLDARIAKGLDTELGDEPFFPDYLLKMLAASGLKTTADARSGIQASEQAIESMVAPYFAVAEQLWQLSPKRMDRLPRGYSLFLLAHLTVLRSATLRLERIERLAQLYRAMDYPDDAKTAHRVASLLVDAFGDIPAATPSR